MSKTAKLRLQLSFEFALDAPDAVLSQSPEDLQRTIQTALGPLVIGGTPTITGKQLAKIGVTVMAHQHKMNVQNMVVKNSIPRKLLISAAPYLTDAELQTLTERAASKAPADEAGLLRHLRRTAQGMTNNEFRMIPCTVVGTLTSGAEARLAAQMNLTNGSVLVDEADRGQRLKTSDPIKVAINETNIELGSTCEGYTLSGPVIQVERSDLSTHRDTFVPIWQGRQ